jgi:lambda family phage portal protein
MSYFRNLKNATRFMGRALMGGSTSFEGASTGRRLALWRETDTAISALLSSEGDELRRRSRGLVRKNHWARCAEDAYVANTIGTGIKPQSLHPDAAVRKQIHELWLRWTDEADADGLTDFYGMQALAMREMFQAGEVFSRFRPRLSSDGLAVPLQLQLIPSEHLPYTDNRVNGKNPIRSGIEFGPYRSKRAAYWLYREHPGLGGLTLSGQANLQTRVAADEVLHLFQPVRAGQYRGQPWLSPVMVTLWELDQFVDAVLVRQKLANMFVGWQRSANLDDPGIQSSISDASGNVAEEGTGIATAEPGSMFDLDPGDTMEFNKPPEPGAEFAPFVKIMLHAFGAGVGLPYTMLNWDSSETNYSSMRGELLEARRRIEQIQFSVLAFQFCRPTYRRWINDAVIDRTIQKPRNEQEWQWLYSARWRTPKWAWVDPLKDGLASKELVRDGFGSRSGVIHELGDDPEQVDADIAADNERADKLGLVFDTDPRKIANNGAAQAAQQADEAQQNNRPQKQQAA